MNDYQSFGSGVTYYRRYAISSALGLVTDVDNDASGEQESKEDKPWLNEQTKEWDAVMKAIKAVAKVLTDYIKEVSTQH